MPSTSSGRISKAQRVNKVPTHQKNHRWESFTVKISKLHSLDPLRKVRRHDLNVEDLSSTTSYFRNGLERWSDLNISKTFTSFKREVLPLSESLAQILHFEDKIMDLLASHISQHDKDAMEPLLDLLTAFARDLGVRFEKHYPRALDLIITIASKPQDAEIIEWTFAALAFLFKYLSRLLVPEMRPTYDALAPLLGKSRQPGHIARFAAEAMSFLIKKAAAPNYRETALPLIIEHARDDLQRVFGTKQFELYYNGLMTLFAESMKSAGQTMHSTATDTFVALLKAIPGDEHVSGGQNIWTNLCCGVLISAIHHLTADTFKPLADRILEHVSTVTESHEQHNGSWESSVFIRFLGIMAGARKGSRISDWSIIKTLSRILKTLTPVVELSPTENAMLFWKHIVVNVAIVWSQAPMDVLIPSIPDLMNSFAKEPLTRWYIPFCAYFADLDSNRFHSLFQTHFQRFIMTHWSDDTNEDSLCVLLPRFVRSNRAPGASEKEDFSIPQSWQDQIVQKFEKLEVTPFPERGAYDKDPKTWKERCLPKYSSLLQVLATTAVHPSTNARIAELLLRKLKLALRPSPVATDEAKFIVSDGFRAYLRMSKSAGDLDKSLSPLLKAAAPRFCRLTGFLEALLDYEQDLLSSRQAEAQLTTDDQILGTEEDPLIQCLIGNLSSSSHRLRLLSLRLLDLLETSRDQQSAVGIMIQIETTRLGPQSTRAIAVQLRKLGQVSGHLEEGSWLCRAIPSFLFGMMTVKLSPVWDDAVEALKQVAQSKTGEDAVAELAFQWLEVASLRRGGHQQPPPDGLSQIRTDFECHNLKRLEELAEATTSAIKDPFEVMLRDFETSQELVPGLPEDARHKALKVHTALPSMAEKRSRVLVPHFLSWVDTAVSPNGPEEELEKPRESSWSLADRKALVGVFAQFINPRVLYQSQEVYKALLKLMANGDIEIQKLALKAILAWKQEGIKPYQENLEYLLDEARFKNELTVLFQGDNKVQPEHRVEVMPIVLRLLFGRTISKKGAASGRHGLHATRLAVIRHLSIEDLGSYLNIALGELAEVQVVDNFGLRESLFAEEMLPPRKQVGMLNMLESIIDELGTAVLPHMKSLVNTILYCLFYASRQLRNAADSDDEADTPAHISLLKVVRTTALKSLCKLFQNAQTFDWTPYQNHIVSEVITPRIDNLAAETTQGVSGTWKLFATWSVLPKAALMLSIDPRVLPKILECLTTKKTKSEVKVFALDIVRNLVKLCQAPAAESEFNELIKSELLDPNLNLILNQIDRLLRAQQDLDRQLLEVAVDTVVNISPFVQKSETVQSLVDASAFLLNQPSRTVNPKIKGSILLILERFIMLGELRSNLGLKNKVQTTLSTLFSFFKDRQNRQTLAKVFQVFASQEESLEEVAALCMDLNSYVKGRLDVPDYDTRLSAYNSISKLRDIPFAIDQWMPLLHNLVFYIQKDEEFGILASNSADGICKFIEATESVWGTSSQGPFEEAVANVVMPAIYAGAKDPSETVRREHLRVFRSLASQLRSWGPVTDLAPLIPADDSDSEKAFFFHILSPATSRQLQALQLLSQINERSELSSKNISQFFIPLLEHFIFGRAESTDDHGLSAQATGTIASLASSLEWSQYRAILRRYISYVESKPDQQKQIIRLLDRFVDALSQAVSSIPSPAKSEEESMDLDLPSRTRQLASTMPGAAKLTDEITNSLLPTLLKHLHEKDESLVSARVPVGIIIVKLLKLTPSDALGQRLPGVLTDISHILRSKAWESREMARDTLCKIVRVLGSGSFGFVLKELRGALTRGYQLHVLSYTMHSILVAVISDFKPGDLNYCLKPIVSVIMDDIFGVSGQEKDAEDYVSKMKEVKSSKSQDSMELVAKNASITHLVDLVQPLKSMLLEKLDIRTARRIDELLSRIAAGLMHNPAAESRDTLVFCYEVIQEVYKSEKPEQVPMLDPKLKRYLVQKGAKRSGERGSTTKHTYKLIRFAFDIMRTMFRKHDSLRTANNISGFLSILGDAVVAGQDEVRVATFKLLTVIVKVPFSTDDATRLYNVAAKEAMRAISTSPSTATDLAQSALKFISVILRDRRDIHIKDAATDILLGRLKDDLTEPLHRHVSFNFLRSVLDRNIETAIVYDTLDYVGTVMITNDDKDTRDLARGAFFQFLRGYPQKKNRWAKQLAFITANLKYDREGGRLSVMEVIHLLLMKSADDFVQEVAATCFIPLVFVLANDESDKCCLAAAELIKEIFRRADRERMQKFMTLLRSWTEQEENRAVLRLALQTFALYFEATDASAKENKHLALAIKRVEEVLSEEDAGDADSELVMASHRLVHALLGKYPAAVLSKDSGDLWAGIRGGLEHSNPAVRLSAVRLLGMYLADFSGTGSEGSAGQSLVGSHGLELSDGEMSGLVRLGVGLLMAAEVEEALAEEAARILIFLGSYLPARPLPAVDESEDESDEESDDELEVEEREGDAADQVGHGRKTELQYLLWRLAGIVRKETRPKAEAMVPKLVALDVLDALCTKTPEESLLPSLGTVLRPLRNITDPSIPTPFSIDEAYKVRHEALKMKAQSVMETLQRRLGTAEYTRQLLAVGDGVKERRQKRLSKRRIEAVTQPERHDREKRKKMERKKERRKAKGLEYRGRRRGY